MTPDDRNELRKLRDEIDDPQDKRLLRKAINHMQALEGQLSTVRTLLRAALNETKQERPNNVREED